MERSVDVLVIGGGIAGLSCAAALGGRARVAVLEREEAFGFHASGRSATWMHLGIGTSLVRALTAASRPFLSQPHDPPLSASHPALFIARREELDQLDALEQAMRAVSGEVDRLDADGLQALVPVLRTGEDHFVAGICDRSARRIDSHALLQAHQQRIRSHAGQLLCGVRIEAIRRKGGHWIVATQEGEWSAPVLVDAAGAWADEVAALAGVAPLGIQPRRRTIIGFDAPANTNAERWPFTKTVAEDGFYMLPETGRLLASPMDASVTDPGDAQAEEIDIATAAWRIEQATTIDIGHIRARWAGLRSFLPDEDPAVGHDPDAPGFFWLAGQGGAGLQTSPALAAAAAALILGDPWPAFLAEGGIGPEQFSPARLRSGPRAEAAE